MHSSTAVTKAPETQPKSPSVWDLLTHHAPLGQIIRYLIVGGANTVFGYGTFAGLTYLFEKRVPHGYVYASALSSIVNITFSFLGYKWFVFRTKGNYLREWVRCLLIYSTSIALSTLSLPFVVIFLRKFMHFDRGAPYIGGAILIGFSAIYSFFGHKKFSFASRQVAP